MTDPYATVPPVDAASGRTLIGPPHTHLDAPCTDACYEDDVTAMAPQSGVTADVMGNPVTVPGEHYDDKTLDKVRRALGEVGLPMQAATDAITVMQNHGILFRETGADVKPEDISDGFHTMEELYDHRRALTAVLAAIGAIEDDSWRSKAHHPDESPMFDGYFIVGIELPGGPITSHYALEHWDEFSAVPVLAHAPKWDGHTSADVVDRLTAFAGNLTDAVLLRKVVQGEDTGV